MSLQVIHLCAKIRIGQGRNEHIPVRIGREAAPGSPIRDTSERQSNPSASNHRLANSKAGRTARLIVKPVLPGLVSGIGTGSRLNATDSVRLQFNFLFASLALQIVEGNVGRLVPLRLSILDPRHIPTNLVGAHAGEAYP